MNIGDRPRFSTAAEKRGLSPFPGLVAFAAGAVAVGAFAPFNAWPLAPIALALLIECWRRAATPRAALLIGWWFGLGLFLAGVSWVYVSMHRFGGMPAALAGLATFLFCALLALFPAAVGWLQAQGRMRAQWRALLVFPPLWVAGEWLRGWVLTGFPWLATGYAMVDAPLAGYAPLGGVYAVSLAGAVCAGLLWCLVRTRARWLAAAGLIALPVLGAVSRSQDWSDPAAAPVSVGLLQGNVPQELKFDPARFARTLATYERLAEGSSARLIVLPETALPRFLDAIPPEYLARLEAVAKRNGGDLLLGVPLRTPPATYTNSVISLGTSPAQQYHKAHLVPFGEFIPAGFSWVNRLLAFPLSDFSAGPEDPAPLEVAGERVAVNICYEDAFGNEIRRQLPAATLLVNVSNVAWFGDSLAPAQHLQIARMRSLETARAHLTATNSGLTAAIDRDARVLAQLPQFTEGRLELSVRGYTGATPYVLFGDAPVLFACALLLAAAAVVARRGASG